MKRSYISIALCTMMLITGSTDAFGQRNGRSDRNRQQNERIQGQRQNNGRHQGATPSSPGKKHSNNSGKIEKEKPIHPSNPGNNKNGNNNSYTRPGRQPQASPDRRPAAPIRPVRPAPPMRPVAPVRPVTPVRPVRPAYRPGRPVYQPWVRPVRPSSWRPARVLPAIRPLFGLNFGMGLNVSINLLNNNGYSVYEYGNETVYLNNVTELNLLWQEGILSYENGGLARTQLYYSTPYYDTTRYNQVYSILSSQYGIPVRANLPGGGVQATWFGNNGGYIQLDLTGRQTYSGSNQFFTTLTFGN